MQRKTLIRIGHKRKINMFIVRYRKIFFILSALLLAGSIFAPFLVGYHLSTDFLGGSILEVKYEGERPDQVLTQTRLEALNLGNFSLRPSGDLSYVLRAREISPTEKSTVISALSDGGKLKLTEERFNSVGPVVGESLKKKSYTAIGVVVFMIVLFVTFAFRKVSRPVASWKYGLATIIALAHDVVIPTGVYIVAGYYFGWEIDLLFVTALLAILGYSVHDTIVVFDRVREHLRTNAEHGDREDFEVTVGKSLKETYGRSINTSLTIFITLAALYLLGSDATKSFAFILLIGVIVGTYSSIFLATPLLVTLEKLQKK